MPSVAEIIRDIALNKIQKADFSGQRLRDSEIENLAVALEGTTSVTFLGLRSTDLSINNIQRLSKAIQKNVKEKRDGKPVYEIDLSENSGVSGESTRGATAIGEMLFCLTSLKLDDMDLWMRHIEVIFRYLADNNTLLKISICRNNFHNAAMKYIADAVVKNKTLQELDLSEQKANNVDIYCVADLVRIIECNSTLRALIVREHQIFPRHVLSIANAARFNRSLTRLELQSNSLQKGKTVSYLSTAYPKQVYDLFSVSPTMLLEMIQEIMKRNESQQKFKESIEHGKGYQEGFDAGKASMKKEVFCEELFEALKSTFNVFLNKKTSPEKIVPETNGFQGIWSKIFGYFLGMGLNGLKDYIDNLNREYQITAPSAEQFANIFNFLQDNNQNKDLDQRLEAAINSVYLQYEKIIKDLTIKPSGIQRLALIMAIHIIFHMANCKSIHGKDLASVLKEGIEKSKPKNTQLKLVCENKASISFADLMMQAALPHNTVHSGGYRNQSPAPAAARIVPSPKNVRPSPPALYPR